MAPKTARSTILPVLPIILAAVLIKATLAIGFWLWQDRTATLARGVQDKRHIALLLKGQLERTIQSIDVVLRELQRYFEGLDTWSPDGELHIPGAPRLRAFMLNRLTHLPEAFQIGIADRTGRLVLSTTAWPTPVVDLGDQPHFAELRNHDDQRLGFSLSTDNGIDAEPAIVMSRRINDVDGTFLGIVFVSVRLVELDTLYKAVDALPNQTFSLFRTDGTLVFRRPDAGPRRIETLPANSEYFTTVRSGGGAYRSSGVFDAVPRWVATYPLKDHALAISVTSPEYVLLTDWHQRFVVVFSGTLVFMVCMALLLWVMTRQYWRLDASESALVAKAAALEIERERLLRNEARLRDSEETLRLQNNRFDATLQNMSQGLVVFDADARLVVCNQRYRDVLRLTPEQTVPGRPLADIACDAHASVGYPADVDTHIEKLANQVAQRQSQRIEARDREGRVLSILRDPLPDGGWVGTFEDITERRQAEAKIERLAHSDLLTGLANRSRFLEELDHSRIRLQSEGQPFTVMMVDLDRFKQVNDSLGHAAGDELLKETARRLQSSLCPEDVVARLGGDEFAVIQRPPRGAEPSSDVAMRECAITLADRIVERITEPYEIAGRKIIVGVSIGIALAPRDGADPQELLQKADLALYRTKAESSNGFCFFVEEIARAAGERLALEADLREGIATNQFVLHYQPIVDTMSRQPRAMEALVRWLHPTRGLIPPDRFIPIAEDTGLIIVLGEWILQAACAEAAKWPADLKLSVNVSPVQFSKTNLLDVILHALVMSGLSPDRLEIEVTERVLLDHEAQHASILHQLRNIGVSIVLDDFGTGYSSLSYLTRFPFDKVKIDRSFTKHLLDRPDCAAVVGAIVNLGHALDIPTVAEGVESEEQLQVLRAAGVPQAQGFLFGRPQAPADAPLLWTGEQTGVRHRRKRGVSGA